MGTVELSSDDARLLALHSQGLVGAPFPVAPLSSARATLGRRTAAVDSVLQHVGAVQLDTISTLARSHELVAYARLGPVERDAVEAAYWGGGRGNDHPCAATSFEYWSHAACILPVEGWPLFAYRRRSYRRLGIRWHEVPTATLDVVRARLRGDGPLTTTDLGGGKNGGQWWDWSATKVAVEWLLDVGEVVCVRRVGWRRVYDLAERAIPVELREPSDGVPWSSVDGVEGPTDAYCVRELLRRSTRVLGVATVPDLIDVHRLSGRHVPRAMVMNALAELVDAAHLVPVSVSGIDGQPWKGPCFADPEALATLAEGIAGRCRTTLLSPFDSLVWDRARTSRVFGFDHRLEAYVPAAKRVHGYFTMPVLHAGRLVARVDPKREGEVLHARQVTFQTGVRGVVSATAIAGTARALREAAAWVRCTSDGSVSPSAAQLVLGRVLPPAAHAPLLAILGVGGEQGPDREVMAHAV